MESYPIGSRVVLKDLTNVEYNGKVGVVKSKLNQNGRQQVCLSNNNESSTSGQDNKILGLKPINLELEPRPVDSLSTREMKTVLSRKDYSSSLAGFDKSELKSLVESLVTCPDEIASILTKAQSVEEPAAPTASSKSKSGAKDIRQQMKNQAAQLNQISPEQLRQQAQMMSAMDPSMIRKMNPEMANFSDAQIQMAATQMESMANNPQMVEGMVEQIENMDDGQLENLGKMQSFAGGGNTNAATVGASASTAPSTPSVSASGMQTMADMTPEQMRQQANMMKSMSKDTLRSLNPAMANWPDSQIDMAIQQMESMANNPEASKRMMDQVKNMKPEAIEKLQKMAQSGGGISSIGSAPGMPDGLDPATQDPMEMLKNTNPAQIKQMLEMVKENPALFKDMIRASNPGMADQLTDEQISKTMVFFKNLDERKIGWLVKVFGLLQNARNLFKKKGFVLLLRFGLVGIVVAYLWRKGKTDTDDLATMVKENEDVISMSIPKMEEDEF